MTSWHKWPEKRKKATRLNALDKDYPILKKKPGRLFGLSFYMLENQWQCNGPTENKSVTIKAYNPRRITYSKLKVYFYFVCIIFDTFTRLIIISENYLIKVLLKA